MKTPDYEHLARIHQDAASVANGGEIAITPWELVEGGVQKARIAGMKAAIEEYDRMRMEQIRAEMPSVYSLIDELDPENVISIASMNRVRELMLSAVEKQLEVEKAPSEKVDRLSKTIENMLARIHRDGGHHTDTVGFEQSMVDADEVISRLNGAQDRLTAAEKRLEEIAKLPEKWRFYVSADACTFELEAILKASTSAEEVSREEFEEAYHVTYPRHVTEAFQRHTNGRYVHTCIEAAFDGWKLARAAKESKAADE